MDSAERRAVVGGFNDSDFGCRADGCVGPEQEGREAMKPGVRIVIYVILCELIIWGAMLLLWVVI